MILLLAGCALVSAEDVFTVDFPIQAPVAQLPPGLAAPPHQVVAPDGSGYAEFDLLPVKDGQDLLVTVVFTETGNKGPSLFWIRNDVPGQVRLSEDLAEGVSGVNQRTIRIPREVSTVRGILYIHGEQTGLLRVRLDWVSPHNIFAAADQRPVAYLLSDRMLQNTELTGERPLSPPDIWLGRTLEAALQEETASLAENIAFAATLDRPVEQAVFTAKVLGLPLNQAVEVWINDQRAGMLQPVIPALSDPGYLKQASGEIRYAGWRTGSLSIPSGLISTGENTILVVAPGGTAFIRDAALQLRAAPQEQRPKEIVNVTDQPDIAD